MNPGLRFVACLLVWVPVVLVTSCGDSPISPGSTGSWSLQTSGTTVDLHAVWGTSPSNVYAVGAQGTILHFDGTTWSAQNSGTISYLWGISGTSASDIYAVGAFSTILHFNGTEWQTISSGTESTLTSVTAQAPDDVYAAGEAGVILHYNGSSWNQTSVGPYAFITGVACGRFRLHPAMDTSVSGVAALTSGGVLYFNDGFGWGLAHPMYLPVYLRGTNGLWIASWQDIFVVADSAVVHVQPTGKQISMSPGPSAFQGIQGSSPNNIYAVGAGMAHFNGTEWETVSTPTNLFLHGVWINSATDGFAVGQGGTILRMH